MFQDKVQKGNTTYLTFLKIKFQRYAENYRSFIIIFATFDSLTYACTKYGAKVQKSVRN